MTEEQRVLKELSKLRSEANNWTEEERGQLGKEMIALFKEEIEVPFPASTLERIQGYLELGALFNPELVNHEEVRDILIAARDQLVVYRTKIQELERIITELTDPSK